MIRAAPPSIPMPTATRAAATIAAPAARTPTRQSQRVAAAYLRPILTARVYDVARETALDVATTLSRRLDNQVLLKREDQQAVYSFKLRGAYNKMAHLDAAELARGVISRRRYQDRALRWPREPGCRA